ncbi:hypothetical protein N825_13885 [Skermanella stibiiresistens SB22]|uniref:Uncharacterized protein n=1 Tax=Skermanella stibiiresistens SB22 TaxID=1385369 RepID=W9GWX0_9PROT|nr:hypothetical protein [Skermanella stibiiresistens]EWY38294.1 hypothetical protein N825_13885 [Skermanella stibiiresistens SB22]
MTKGSANRPPLNAPRGSRPEVERARLILFRFALAILFILAAAYGSRWLGGV